MTFKINEPTVVYQVFPDEVLAIDLEVGDYFSMTQVAAEIWHLLVRGVPQERMAMLIGSRSMADPERVLGDIAEFLAVLEKERLIVPSPPAEAWEEAGWEVGARGPYQKPVLNKYSDMQELLLLDPIHDVDESGWPGTQAPPRPS